jgi:hypothetical protein
LDAVPGSPLDTIVILILFAAAVSYLLYIRELGATNLTLAMQRGAALSKYLIASFTAVFGSAAVALFFSLPLLLFSRLAHSEGAMDIWSALLDRPYFPLQLVAALVLGWISVRWLKEGWLSFVWALPLVQAVVALAVYVHRFAPSDWNDIWVTFFNWQCGCSASLPQWRVMFPLYTSIAFALGAFFHARYKASVVVTRKFAQIGR